jgi:hypothetical protein
MAAAVVSSSCLLELSLIAAMIVLLLLLRLACDCCLQGHEGYEDNMIDDAIEDEFNENEQSFNPVSLHLQRCYCKKQVACSVSMQ